MCVHLQVSNNGYFSMGETPRYYALDIFPSPSNYSIVAPFAADITTSSTGDVRYSESFTNSQLNYISEHIRSEMGNSFSGTWMLVAEWNGVPLLSQSSVSMQVGIFLKYKMGIDQQFPRKRGNQTVCTLEDAWIWCTSWQMLSSCFR